MKRALLVLALTPSCVLALSSSASAAAPQRVGWWTSASVTSPREVVVPVGSDVPAGGLLVQSAADPTAPLAFGGATWELPEGTTVTKLVLKVVGSGTTTGASLGLCALQRPDFVPADGGAIASAPAYDCRRQLTAVAAADGSFTFNPESLRTGPLLAVAIVPTAPVSRIVVAPLGPDSLSTRSATAPAAMTPTAVPPVGAALPEPAHVPIASLPGLVAGPAVAPQTPGEVAPAPITAAPQGASPTRAGSASPRQPKHGFQHQGLLALLLAAAVVTAWSAAGASASRPAQPPPVS